MLRWRRCADAPDGASRGSVRAHRSAERLFARIDISAVQNTPVLPARTSTITRISAPVAGDLLGVGGTERCPRTRGEAAWHG
jgi:hypothetical protein